MTDEIINGNYKNIEYKVRISVVLEFERKSKVVNDFAKKSLGGPLLKEHQIVHQIELLYLK